MSPPLSAPSVSKTRQFSSPASLFSLLFSGVVGLWLLASPSVFCTYPPSDHNYWPSALAFLCLAVASLFGALDQQLRFRVDSIGLGLLLFCGWNVFATTFGVYQHDSWIEMARLTGGLFLYFAVRAVPSHVRAYALCAVAGTLIPAVLAIVSFLSSHNAQQQAGFINTNLFAALLAPALMLAPLLFGVVRQRTNARVALGITVVPCLVLALALFVTSSKGGFLSALIAGVVFIIALFRAKRMALTAILKRTWPILLVLALAFGLIAARTVGKRLAQTQGGDENSTQFRVYLWRSTLTMIQARPFFGFGPGNFATAYPHYAQAGFARAAHQTWLQIASEGGWPALVLILGTFALAVRQGWRKLGTSKWLEGACGIAALCAVFTHGFVDSGWTILAVLALVAVALALCSFSDELPNSNVQRRGLNLPFLGVTLVLLLAGYGTQKVANGEDLLAQDEARLENGLAPTQVGAAIEMDPGSARAWNFLGRTTPNDNPNQWTTAFETAIRLQPTNGIHPLYMARQIDRLPSPISTDIDQVAKLYNRAVSLDPLNSSYRLERAKWRLDHNDKQGSQEDLEFVLREWDEPYGKYPALGRDRAVNLDFARAALSLAPYLKASGQTARLESLTKRGLDDCAAARALTKTYGESLQELTKQGFGNFSDIDSLESGLKEVA